MRQDPTAGCAFTYEHFRQTLEGAQGAGYTFASFPDVAAGRAERPFVLLRHDVDHSAEDAVSLAEIETDLGVRATYFVLPSAEYNVLGRAHAAVQRLIDLGHSIGLHYDPSHYLDHGLPFPETVHREAAILRDRFDVDIAVAARHNPTSGRQVNAGIDPLIDAYGLTKEITYLSDSCGSWRAGCFCRAIAPGGHGALQVLIHAEWWSHDGAPAHVILERLRDRRIAAVQDRHLETRRLFASLAHLPNRDQFRGP